MKRNKFKESVRLLSENGIAIDQEVQGRIDTYVHLIESLNPVLSLVSTTDAAQILEVHVVDSLSLVPLVAFPGKAEARGAPQGSPAIWAGAKRIAASFAQGIGLLLDIGSGGGFPAIPMKLVLSGLDVVLVERSSKKAAFLRRVVGELGLTGMEVIEGPYPAVGGNVRADWITARAVDKPERLMRHILERCEGTCQFLCQFDLRDNWPQKFHVEHLVGSFHVEPVHDDWERLGLRRGDLQVFSRKSRQAPSPRPYPVPSNPSE